MQGMMLAGMYMDEDKVGQTRHKWVTWMPYSHNGCQLITLREKHMQELEYEEQAKYCFDLFCT